MTGISPNDDPPAAIHRPSQLDYHHLHARPAFPSPPSSSSSSSSGQASPLSPFPSSPNSRPKNPMDVHMGNPRRASFYSVSPTSPRPATTLQSLSSASGPTSTPNSSSSKQLSTVSQLVSQYNLNLSSSFSSLTNAGHPRNISSSALYLPGLIKNSTDIEAEYHVFIFTDIVLWTKRVMSRHHRKEGTPWNFKLVEPVSRLTSVCHTSEGE